MTYDPGIPNASNSPGIFPAQSQANFGRLQTLLGADHQFNNSAATTDGWHNLVHMIPPNPDPTGALSGYGRLYSKADSGGVQQLHFMTDAGSEYQITPAYSGAGIVAAVNFDGVSGAVIRSQLNVTSVTRSSTGRYRINFTNPIANANYIATVTGMRNTTSSAGVIPCMGFVMANATYSNSVSTTYLDIGFAGLSQAAVDVIMGNVVIYSV